MYHVVNELKSQFPVLDERYEGVLGFELSTGKEFIYRYPAWYPFDRNQKVLDIFTFPPGADIKGFYTEMALTIPAGASAWTIALPGATVDTVMSDRSLFVRSSGAIRLLVELYRGVTFTGTPTSIPVHSLDHHELDVAQFAHWTGLTASGGTLLPGTIEMETPNNVSSREAAGLKYRMAHTHYGLRFHNQGSQAVNVKALWSFYEIT